MALPAEGCEEEALGDVIQTASRLSRSTTGESSTLSDFCTDDYRILTSLLTLGSLR